MQPEPLEILAKQAGFTLSRVNVSIRGQEKKYRFFLKSADGKIAADGQSLDECEAQEWLRNRGKD